MWLYNGTADQTVKKALILHFWFGFSPEAVKFYFIYFAAVSSFSLRIVHINSKKWCSVCIWLFWVLFQSEHITYSCIHLYFYLSDGQICVRSLENFANLSLFFSDDTDCVKEEQSPDSSGLKVKSKRLFSLRSDTFSVVDRQVNEKSLKPTRNESWTGRQLR